MTTTTKAAEIARNHTGAKVTIKESKVTIHKNLSASEMAALGNRIDYCYADLSGDSATLVMEKEIHFISIDYDEQQAVVAASKEEALEKAESEEYQDPTHLYSESDMKDYLKNNEVFHL